MSGALPLARQQVHIWLVDPTTVTDADLLARYHELLTPEEHAKWQRYRFDKDKHQHLVTRALIRDTLSRYEPSIAPQDWRFEFNAHGKPAIANALSGPLHFNLSHTQNLAALAVTRCAPVGVDVEKIKTVEQVRGLAERCFTDGEIAFVFGGDKAAVMERFFKLWTLKEAYIKAHGCGMSLSLHSVAFDPLAEPLTVNFDATHDDRPEEWSFRHWELGEHLLSLALNVSERRSVEIEFFHTVPLHATTPLGGTPRPVADQSLSK
jgi:Phosphopantetheinyl transferase